jgi:hypothetical protein
MDPYKFRGLCLLVTSCSPCCCDDDVLLLCLFIRCLLAGLPVLLLAYADAILLLLLGEPDPALLLDIAPMKIAGGPGVPLSLLMSCVSARSVSMSHWLLLLLLPAVAIGRTERDLLLPPPSLASDDCSSSPRLLFDFFSLALLLLLAPLLPGMNSLSSSWLCCLKSKF